MADPMWEDFTDDSDVLRQFLTGRTANARTDRILLSGESVRTRCGAWWVLNRNPHNQYFLSLDKPLSTQNPSPEWWRAEIMQAAREVGADILPVADRSYYQATRKTIYKTAPDTNIVEVNDRLESVFSVDDNYYLSGFDSQEDPPLYFLCRLPYAVASIEEARESLKPTSVLDAEFHGWRVARQGDIFAIESTLTDDDLIALGAEIFEPFIGPALARHHWPPLSRVPIYGTAHTSYHVARLPNNVMLAKGPLVHAPSVIGQRRKPDHVNRALGDADSWWWLTRNTVPKQERGEE